MQLRETRLPYRLSRKNYEGDPLGAARATVVGDVEAVSEAEISSVRELYLARHDNSRSWVDFDDFSFYRLQPLDIYYVGGFGVMGWVSADDYRQAKPDPLAEAAPGILAHMNADPGDDSFGAGPCRL